MRNQKGIVWAPVLIISVAVVIGLGIVFFKKDSAKPIEEASPTPVVTEASSSASPTQTTQPQVSTKTSTSMSPSPSLNCDQSKNICFESNDTKITLNEGYKEDKDYWRSNALSLTGQGGGGFELTMEGMPEGFSLNIPYKSFTNGTKQEFFITAHKRTAKKGTYTGKLKVKSNATGNTTTSNLTLTYADWNDSLTYVDPGEIILNCKAEKGDSGMIGLNCKEWNDLIRLYYFGKHNDMEVKSVSQSGGKGLKLRTEEKGLTTFNMENIQNFGANLDGFEANNPNGSVNQQELANEPSGTYKGRFIFLNGDKKEIVNIPYTLNFTGLQN